MKGVATFEYAFSISSMSVDINKWVTARNVNFNNMFMYVALQGEGGGRVGC